MEMELEKPVLQQESPPTYDAATAPDVSPPTYEQVFGMQKIKQEVMEAKQSSSKPMFAVKLCNILCGSVLCMVGLLILAALPLAMIIIGAIYLNDCPGRRLIPIWLIVFGCFSLASTLINVLKRLCKCIRKKAGSDEGDDDDQDCGRKGGSCLESLISLFLFVWILIGSAWVFGYYSTYANCPGVDLCCHAVPFLFSFVTLIVIYAVSFLSLCCCCFCFVCLAFLVGASE